jgi:D-alanyl-D-alanine carboxypeptidase/D-alanyl-D-alanine-endopeptidase (penicillin-binding protein 4)
MRFGTSGASTASSAIRVRMRWAWGCGALLSVLLGGCASGAPRQAAETSSASPNVGDGDRGGAAAVGRDTVFVIDTTPRLAQPPENPDTIIEADFTDWYLNESDRARLDRSVRAVIDRPPYSQMWWGVLVRDMHDGRTIYERNSTKKFVPASNMKVLSSAAALMELGPDFRYETTVWGTGSVSRNGTLDGSLVLVGSGDPTWSDRFHPSWRSPLDEVARQLRERGVRRVTGRLVIDASVWDSSSVGGTWQYDDLPWGWAATGGAFVVADGDLRLRVQGTSPAGREATVTIDPALPPARFDARVMTTVTDSIRIYPGYRYETGQIVVEGEIPPGRGYSTRLAMRDPVRISGELLLAALRDAGIRIEGGLGFAWDRETDLGSGCAAGRVHGCPAASRLATITSPPLITIARALLQPSQNWITEQMVRTLGAQRAGVGGWDEGLLVMQERLGSDLGVLGTDLDLHDGSGLSSYNLVTPRAMVDVLFRMRIQPFGEDWVRALASPGQDDSTLSSRLRDLRGRLFAKTGTIHHVNSLSGYLIRDNGRELVFSILTNSSGLESREVRRGIDALVRELARW